MNEQMSTYFWVFGFAIMVLICMVVFGLSYISNQPPFSDEYNEVETTSVVSSCAYDFWTSRTNVYLNNGLKLYYRENIQLFIGRNYTITYRQDSQRILSFKLLDGS